MPASDTSSSVAGIVAEATVDDLARARRRARAVESRKPAREIPDANEAGLQRRARRQALALMIASGLVSILALYGVWTLLRAVT